MAKPTTVDEYIAAAPEQAQKHVNEIRAILKEVAPDAREATPALQVHARSRICSVSIPT